MEMVDSMGGSRDEGRVSFLVDPTMYQGAHAFPGGPYVDLDQVVRADLYYHYSSPICAQRWLDVCEDPIYGHGDLLARLDRAVPGLVGALAEDRSTTSRIRVTSLGPGDGAVDEHLLLGLDRDFEVDSYRGLDFSFDLLRRATHRLSNARGFRTSFPITMVCGDFTGVDSSLARNGDRAGRQLFSLTGFTLGNYREDRLLESIGTLMMPGDYLLLDARLHAEGQFSEEDFEAFRAREEVSGHYDVDSVRRFVFGPVEVATTATTEDVEIRFEVARALTVVPNALNLIIYCSDLDTNLRLTGETVKRERLDLAVTSTYHLPDLLAWFPSTGFSAVWHEDLGDAAFLLLRKN